MKNVVWILVGALALSIAWFLASPLFIDESVDESFDLVKADGHLNMERVKAMPAARRRTMMPQIMEAAAGAPDRQSADAMPENSPQLIATGAFVDADAIHKGRGQALIYGLPDGRHVVRFEEFRVTNGPALVVYLARHPSPTRADDVRDGGFLKLGELKGNVGNQNYPVPPAVDISDYGSVVIWCELFGVLFSPAALTRT